MEPQIGGWSSPTLRACFAISVNSETKKLKGLTPRDYAAIAFFSGFFLRHLLALECFDWTQSVHYISWRSVHKCRFDIVPSTDGEKLFMTGFVLVSIVVIGLAFGLLFASLTEAEENRIEKLRLSMLEDDKWIDDRQGEEKSKVHGSTFQSHVRSER